MRVILPGKPFHRIGFSTMWAGSTYGGARKSSSASSVGLFVLAAAATRTVFIRDPRVSWGYALGIFLLGGSLRISVAGAAAAVISWWGFAQLAAGLASGSRAGARLGRFAEKDAFRYRREMAASSVRMIRDHPWQGWGLGTYASVYPAYATFDLGATQFG